MSNYTVLQRNIINSLASEDAVNAFLWASDKPDDGLLYRAEAYAREVDELSPVVGAFLGHAATAHGLESVPSALDRFILDRHRNMRYPQQGRAA